MAPTLNQIRAGLEVRLDTIAGLRVAKAIADQINPPQAVVGLPAIPSYHSTMGRGVIEVAPTIMVFTSTAVDRIGQDRLADYADPTGSKSVRQVIEADRTLGGVVHDCIVVDFRPLNIEEVGLIGYYGGLWVLKCLASGA